MKTTWLLLLFEKKPTSLSKVADMFRQSSVPIETPDLDSRLQTAVGFQIPKLRISNSRILS